MMPFTSAKATTCIAHRMRRHKREAPNLAYSNINFSKRKKNRLPSCLDGCHSKLQVFNDSCQERCIKWSAGFMLTNPNGTKSGLSLSTSAAKFLKISFGHVEWCFMVNKKYTTWPGGGNFNVRLWIQSNIPKSPVFLAFGKWHFKR